MTSAPEPGDLALWLAQAAEERPEIERLFDHFCDELVQRGLALTRCSLNLELLHPEVSGTQLVWTRHDALAFIEAARAGVATSPSYLRSPMRVVDETNLRFRRRLDAPQDDMPLLAELRRAGASDYLMQPLPFLDRSRSAAMSFATDAPRGFDDTAIESLALAARCFSPYAERHVLRRMAIDLMNTYVGRRTGRRIFEGRIERGDFERIEAAIWLADLRGFTRLSEENPVEIVVTSLDQWLEPMVAVIERHDGEVLKFMGDAVLAIFPTASDRPREAACRLALAAAEAFVGERTHDPVALDFGLALHVGEVAYGNVGAPTRLDFTVIGQAVNRVARLQELTKTLGRRLLVSRPFADALDRPLVDLGRHALRDIAKPLRVFGLPHDL